MRNNFSVLRTAIALAKELMAKTREGLKIPAAACRGGSLLIPCTLV